MVVALEKSERLGVLAAELPESAPQDVKRPPRSSLEARFAEGSAQLGPTGLVDRIAQGLFAREAPGSMWSMLERLADSWIFSR